MLRLALFAALLVPAAGHASMTVPPPRNAAWKAKWPGSPGTGGGIDGAEWFSQGCQPGCSECTDTFSTNPCRTPMRPTVTDPKFRTWARGIGGFDYTPHNPWRSPGHAPVLSPCGIAGGGNTLHPSNGAFPPGYGIDKNKTFKNGFDGRDLPEVPGVKTQWPQGSTQEVAWNIHANHGGGYAYRLCPKSSSITEECFQKHHLQFAGEQSWVQWIDKDESNRTSFIATQVSEGTNPQGSQWRKNPIPACGDATGGVAMGMRCTLPPQFDSPVILADGISTLYGYGQAACFQGLGALCTKAQADWWVERFNFKIIDKVSVPADLPAGDYMLSFRWDSEQTPQVWAQCADVTITAKDVVIV